ncbi:MAG: hypothetical protein P4L77_03155 [Sulfuriferula sp.]|nr:hypothetical protein [Sulfuriferula sp.]
MPDKTLFIVSFQCDNSGSLHHRQACSLITHCGGSERMRLQFDERRKWRDRICDVNGIFSGIFRLHSMRGCKVRAAMPQQGSTALYGFMGTIFLFD